MPEEMNRLLRDYFDRKISRRDFIRKAMSAAGGFVAGETLLERFARDQAYGGEVNPKDPAIRVGSCRVSRKAGKLFGYVARPSVPGKYPR